MSESNATSVAPDVGTELPPEPTGRAGRIGRLMQDKPVIVLGAILVVLYLVTGAIEPTMFTSSGLRTILVLACPLGIFAAAQTICMLTGGIDMSIPMIANFAAYVGALHTGAHPVRALVLSLLVGVGVGLVNGIGVGAFKVNPLVMTLGMSTVLVGIVTVGMVGQGFLAGPTRTLPAVNWLASGTLFGPIPAGILLWIPLAAIIILGLSRTGLGRSIYAVGDNPEACRLGGVRVWQVHIMVYVIAGLLAAIGGLMFSGQTQAVGPDNTNNYLLPAIAAVVIGGTSILGGIGGYTGTILGTLILTVIVRLLLVINANEGIQQITYGAIILALAWTYAKISGQRAD